MKSEAYEQYRSEAKNWLKQGRCQLLRELLRKHGTDRPGLRILEIGAGVGQNLEVMREYGTVDVLEIDPVGLEALRALDGIDTVYDDPIPAQIDQRWDAIVAFDVLEHLEDDRAASQWVADHLNPGGLFIASVPAYQWMFSDHDVALMHYRRYTRRRLMRAMGPDLTVRQAGYFVCLLFPAAAAMRTLGKVKKRLRSRGDTADTQAAVRKQSADVPAALDAAFLAELSLEVKAIAAGRRLPFGLSTFCVAEKS